MRLLISILLFVSSMAFAEISVTLQPQLQLLAINDTPYQDSELDLTKIMLSPGNNKLLVKYADEFGSDGDVDKIVSRQLIIVFEADPGFEYTITTERPDNLEAARKFANSPTYNIERKPIGADNDFSEVVSESSNLQKLKMFWNAASDEDKATFLRYISEDEK